MAVPEKIHSRVWVSATGLPPVLFPGPQRLQATWKGACTIQPRTSKRSRMCAKRPAFFGHDFPIWDNEGSRSLHCSSERIVHFRLRHAQ